MVGGRLVLTGYGGGVNAIDPATGARGDGLSRRDAAANVDRAWTTAARAANLVDRWH